LSRRRRGAGAIRQPRVVARWRRRRNPAPMRGRQGPELIRSCSDAWVRGFATRVGLHKSSMTSSLKRSAKSQNIERDVEEFGDASGVPASPWSSSPENRYAGFPVRRQGQVHAETSCPASTMRAAATGGVHTAAHRDQNAHHSPLFRELRLAARPAAPCHRGRSTASPRRRRLGAGVSQRQSQRSPGTGRVGAHRDQDV